MAEPARGSAAPVTAHRWVMTCDPGIDDAVALAVAAGRDDVEVVAVVAGAGNVGAATAWRNAAGLAALLGLDAGVAMGSTVTVGGARIDRAGTAHGVDGLAGLSGRLPPAGAPVRPPAGAQSGAAGAVRGEVVATGPLTDVALALRSGQAVARVTWLGGSIAGLDLPPRSPIPRASGGEFNAAADATAATEVLASVSSAVVPVEVSSRVVLAGDDLGRWASGPPPARFCADLAATRLGRAGVVLHDPVAVMAALEPGLFRWERRPLRCTATGLLAVGAPPAPPAGLAVDVDAPAVRDRIVAAVLESAG